MKLQQPYMDWRGQTQLEENIILPYEIKFDADTRIRVYRTQLADEVVDNINAFNYLYQIQIYHHLGENLLKKFPERHDDIMDASMLFWERVQIKLKELKNSGNNQTISK